MRTRPEPSEYAPYFERYVKLVPEGDLLPLLARQGRETVEALRRLPDGAGRVRYAPDKWSVSAVCAHVADTERVMALRVLWALRRDPAVLPSFDQDAWAAASGADERPLGQVVDDLEAVRAATLTLAAGAAGEAWRQSCSVGGQAMSARAALFVVAGHELHHRRVLRERYALSLP